MSMCLPFKGMNECSLHPAGGPGVGQVKMAGGLGDLQRFSVGKTQGSIIGSVALPRPGRTAASRGRHQAGTHLKRF